MRPSVARLVWQGLPLCVGAAVLFLLLRDGEFGRVLNSLSQIGWGLVAIVGIRAALLAACAAGWRQTLPPGGPTFIMLFRLRMVREAINVLLPVATIGGEVVGVRLLTRQGVASGAAAAGGLVDLLLQSVGQAAFALLGIGLLAAAGLGGAIVPWALGATGIFAVGLVGFLLAQRSSLIGWIERGVLKAAAAFGAKSQTAWGVAEHLNAIYRHPDAVLRSLFLHAIAWLMGAAEIYVALECLGREPTLAECLVIESLAQAIRGATFIVPAGLGVQEGAFVLLGSLYGIPLEQAVALSFAKRSADIALGLPALLDWWRLERRPRPATPDLISPTAQRGFSP